MKKVLITQPWPVSYVSDFDLFVNQLEEAGLEVVLDRSERTLSEQELMAITKDVYASICGGEPWNRKTIENARELKIISRIGVGFENVDIPYATAKGIAVTTTPGAGAEAVAEQALAMMLAVARQLLQGDKMVRNGWGKVIGPSLYRKTLGIIGLGHIGKQLARIVRGFDMKVIAYDPVEDRGFARANNITYVPFDELLKTSDFISLHLPKNPDTIGLIGERELALMKPSAIIVNCARGGIIDENALYDALKNKRIFGAGVDVFEKEPLRKGDTPLAELDNVVLMPHNAGISFEGRNKVVGAAVQNVVDLVKGKKPAGLLNPEVLV